MSPILIDFGELELGALSLRLVIPSYGAVFVVALLVAWRVVLRLGRQVDAGVPWTDLFFLTVIAGFVGAKLAILLVFLPDLLAGRRPPLGVLQASGIWLGGVVLAIPVALMLLRRHCRLAVGTAVNIAFVAIPLAHVPGRIGCFLAGCCYGAATDVPWAVTYGDPRAQRINGTPLGVAVHPSQLYESGLELVNFVVCYRLWRSGATPWSIMATWFGLYGAERFVLEYFRGDARGALGPLSTSQWIALAMIGLSAGLVWWLRSGPPAGTRNVQLEPASRNGAIENNRSAS